MAVARTGNLLRISAALTMAVALSGCANDNVRIPADAGTTGRAITQNAPAPEYTVMYWSALRACLQTGRSEWECKSGEDRFVRDALAIESELNAQRQLKRDYARARADFEAEMPEADATMAFDTSRWTRSIMIDTTTHTTGADLSLFEPIALPTDPLAPALID